MRHLFIINPAAGKRETTPHLEGLLDRLSFPHEVVYTEKEGDARRFTEEAVRTGEPVRVYACGGDGTLNEVVNGAAGCDHVAVTNVPKGTGNDFLKIFGPDYRKLFYDLEALADGPQTPFDLIDCNGHLGIDVVCAGVDARIAADVHRYKDWRFVSGMGAYVLSLIENVFFKGIARPMSVHMGEIQWVDQPASLLCVCNGRHYGGGFMPVGEALPDDGVLDMLLVRQVGLLTFLRLVGKYAKGLYKQYPELILDYHGQQVTFSAPEPISVVVDGEVMRDRTFAVRLSEKRVNFFYPAGADYRLRD
ncbi:YegS/Rv2252/BmrU family lipid kinase [Colidextribacter sp. OB.20]|uniref:diacylglycerol/lipid kinase family protein n=1 Tax=Colidextribacter sp. OB.20 TaxID=2304568 RepID=UPI001370662D|nr:YegS/Rv2252/BmrU family lipid kinase [Colidextribacter sp. OB.20]NBI11192.1 YegS/Rv2252/BmrU family lipid kinase [Colidextribacter sp. OB.20]